MPALAQPLRRFRNICETLMEDTMSGTSGWTTRIKQAIRRRLIQQTGNLDEGKVEQDFQNILNMEVPSDAELIAMQQRGELPSDEKLAHEYP